MLDPRSMADNAAMPPITELTRIEPVLLEKLERQGTFTTGLLLERSETATRRQYLADQLDATTNDVLAWRDEALMLNLASFGPDDHQLLIQAGIEGLRDILDLPADVFRPGIHAAAIELNEEPPTDADDRGLVGAGRDARGRVAGPAGGVRAGLRCPRAYLPTAGPRTR